MAGARPILSPLFSSTYVNLNFLDFPVDTRNWVAIIHRMNTEQVGVSAIMFNDLKNSRIKDEATNPQEKDILEIFEKFISCGYPFSIALKMTFVVVQPDMPWETFKLKLYQILHDLTP